MNIFQEAYMLHGWDNGTFSRQNRTLLVVFGIQWINTIMQIYWWHRFFQFIQHSWIRSAHLHSNFSRVYATHKCMVKVMDSFDFKDWLIFSFQYSQYFVHAVKFHLKNKPIGFSIKSVFFSCEILTHLAIELWIS